MLLHDSSPTIQYPRMHTQDCLGTTVVFAR